MYIREMIDDFNSSQDVYISEYSRIGVSIKRVIGDLTITEMVLSWPIDSNELGDIFESYLGDINLYHKFDVVGHF